MKLAAVLFSFLFLIPLSLSGCCSSKETVERTIRDTVLVFQPPPISDTLTVPGDAPSGIYNPDCDTISILNRYGNILAEKDDSLYYWRVKFNAATRRLEVAERRAPETRTVTVETTSKKTEIRTMGFWAYAQVLAVGAVLGIGLFLIGLALLKR